MARAATAEDILHILARHPVDICTLLGEPEAQLSFPTDGKGIRIEASVPSKRSGTIEITYLHHGMDEISITVEFYWTV